MNIKTNKLVGVNCVRMFFPMSENGADVDPVDIIRGITLDNSVSLNVGDGTEVTFGAELGALAITAGTLPRIAADESFILLITMANWGTGGVFGLGDLASGSRLVINDTGTTATIVTDSETVALSGLALADQVNPHSYALACNRGVNTEFIVDGVVDVTGAAAAGAVNFGSDEIGAINLEGYSVILLGFAGTLPPTYLADLAWWAPYLSVNAFILPDNWIGL